MPAKAQFKVIRSKLRYPLHQRRGDQVLVIPPSKHDPDRRGVMIDGRSKAIPAADADAMIAKLGEWQAKRYIYAEYAAVGEDRAWEKPVKLQAPEG